MNKFTLIENKAIDKPVEYVILNITEQSDDTGDQYFSRDTGAWNQLGLATRFTEEERIKCWRHLGEHDRDDACYGDV
jgi:hypothetical protein